MVTAILRDDRGGTGGADFGMARIAAMTPTPVPQTLAPSVGGDSQRRVQGLGQGLRAAASPAAPISGALGR